MTQHLQIQRASALVAIALALSACGTDAPAVEPAASSVVVTLSPDAATVPVSGRQTFAAAVTGTAEVSVTWSVQEGAAGGSVANGEYTAPGSTGTFHLVVTSVADSTKTATATVTVTGTPLPADTARPSMVAFAAKGTASPVQVVTFTGTDNVGVTGYMITESATPPSAASPSWQSSVPSTYATVSRGPVMLYPWVRDAAGNVSAPFGTPVTLTLAAPVSSPKMGTNLNWLVDWDPEKLPADLIWGARPWSLGAGNGGNGEASAAASWAPIDTAGWPIVSPGTGFGLVVEQNPWPGVYKLSFTNRNPGSGDTVSSAGGGGVLSNRVHSPTTNVTTYDLTVTRYSPGSEIRLMWAGSTGGVTNVHLMRPLKNGNGWHAIGTPLSDFIVDRLAWFTTIRPMQTQGGESGKTGGCDDVWAHRTSPWGPQTRARAGSVTREVGVAPWRGTRASSGGVAIENMVAMANQAGKNLWIIVPYNATDDYITKMAQAIRYGTNGFDPYTSPQASPVFAPLASNLAVYVEYANEIWNPSAGYWNAESYRDSAADVSAGDAKHYTYRAGDAASLSYRRTGYQAVRHSLLFRAVFGDAAMMTRVRPVLGAQHGGYGTSSEPLYYIRDVWGPGSTSTVPYGQVNQYGNVAQPVSYYLYGVATAPYVPSGDTPINSTSASTLLTSAIADLNSTLNERPVPAISFHFNLANSLGIKLLAYEGGDNLIPGVNNSASAATCDIASYNLNGTDGRMGANIGPDGLPLPDQSGFVYGRLFKEWSDRGGDLFCHFTLGADRLGLSAPSATSLSDMRLEVGPKWNAVKAFSRVWGQ